MFSRDKDTEIISMMKIQALVLALIFCFSFIVEVKADDVLEILTAEDRYEQNVRPKFYEGLPLDIFVRFKIIAADDIQVQTGDFHVDVNFFFMWHDHRLQYDDAYDHDYLTIYDEKLINKIWLPDVFIVNAKNIGGHSLKHVKISRNGTVMFMIRLSVRAACNVELQMFPWDTQYCPLIIQSYSHSLREIRMTWDTTSGNDQSYVKGMRERPMSQFDLEDFNLFTHSKKSAGGTISSEESDVEELSSTLEAVFTFKRLNGFYLIQTLAPSNILVVLSWVAFLIKPEDSPPRVFLGISCILTMAAIQNAINASLPKVSYIKVIDIYCLTCYFFVVLVMVEYAVVLLLNERVKKEKIFLKENKLPKKANGHIQQISSFCKFWPKLKLCIYGNPFCMHVTKRTVRLVDKVSMWLFPISYIIFNIAYWTYVARTVAVKKEIESITDLYA